MGGKINKSFKFETSNDPITDHECSKNIAVRHSTAINPNIPDVVIVVRTNGDNVGNDLTVFREPQAKTPEAKRPKAKPAPIER